MVRVLAKDEPAGRYLDSVTVTSASVRADLNFTLEKVVSYSVGEDIDICCGDYVNPPLLILCPPLSLVLRYDQLAKSRIVASGLYYLDLDMSTF